MSKYNYNKDYFQQINTNEKAYWLGFLYADGCISRTYKNDKLKNMSLELSLCGNDKRHLEKFNQALESNVPIRKKISKYKDKEYEAYRLVINCTKMCYDLIDKKCTPNKTYDVRLPSYDIVPKEYMKDFLRGFFDGDGCICVTTMNNKPHIETSITGMEAMLNDIASFLITEKIITVNPKIHHDKRSLACSIYFYGDTVKDFLDYIYKDSNIYLDRKYEKYINYYKDYVLDRHGVNWSFENKAYIVTIRINNEHIRVGQSKDLKTAIQMRKEAEIKKMNIENCPLSQ